LFLFFSLKHFIWHYFDPKKTSNGIYYCLVAFEALWLFQKRAILFVPDMVPSIMTPQPLQDRTSASSHRLS
jgi:hypothetical protein